MCKMWKRSSNEGNRRQYCETEKVVRRVVAAAMGQTSMEGTKKFEFKFDDCELLQIARQRAE